MAWYWILLIVLAALPVGLYLLSWIPYMLNLDNKGLEMVYDLLMKYHDKKKPEGKI